MKTNIAICDDEYKICLQMERLLESILLELSIRYEIDIFCSSEKLCLEMSKTNYDIVFLDIELPGMNGVETGKYIREELKDESVQIAYISAKKEYAMELFEIRPINFLIKPLEEEGVQKVINKYLTISKQNNYNFEYKKRGDSFKVPMSEILYFEGKNRKVAIVMKSGADEFYGSMEDIYSQVKKQRFLFIHKSIIVNYNFIKRFGYEQVTMVDGQTFPISQSRRKAIRKMHMNIRKDK